MKENTIKLYESNEGLIQLSKEKLTKEFKQYHKGAKYEYYLDIDGRWDQIFYSMKEVNKFLKEVKAEYIGEE